MFYSDDYAGASIGKLEFYYGYEATKCLRHPEKSDEYCESVDCDEREWCFEVSIDNRVIYELSKSELDQKHPTTGLYSPLEYLLAGIETYFKENKHICSLHLLLLDERIIKN